MRRYHIVGCLAKVGGVLLLGGGAHTVNAQSSGDFQLEEIVVTAQKTSQSIQDTPLTITAVTGAQMETLGITDLVSMESHIGGFHMYNNGPVTQISIRGIGTSSALAQNDPSAATNVDGVYRARASSFNNLAFDINRIEVIKGPMGTLYGRNATVGGVNIIHNQPSREPSVSATFEAGNYSLFRAGSVVNMPLSDSVALRGAVQTLRHSGYRPDGYSDADEIGGRLSALYDSGSPLSVLVIGDYFHNGGFGEGSTLENTSPSPPLGTGTLYQVISSDRWFSQAQAGSVDIKDWGFSTEINYDLGGPVVTVIPAYRYSYSLNNGYSSGARFGTYNQADSDTWSMEARIGSAPESKLRWVGGVYYYHDDLRTDVRTLSVVVEPTRRANVTNAGYGDMSYAAFAQVTVPLGVEWLRVTGGGRYTRQERELSGSIYSFDYRTDGPKLTQAQIDATKFGSIPLSGKADFDRVDWRAGLELDVGPNTLVYASASSGFKAGGLNARDETSDPVPASNPLTFSPATYDPETILAYELGVKNTLLDNRMNLNLAVFDWQYEGRQALQNYIYSFHLPATQSTGFRTFSAGPMTIYGADIEMTWKITPTDLLGLSYYYLHGRFDDVLANQNANGDAGQVIGNAPTDSVSANYSHEWTLGNSGSVTFNADAKYESESYASQNRFPQSLQEAYEAYNASVVYASGSKGYTLSGWIRNITNQDVKGQTQTATAAGVNAGANLVRYSTIRAPRTYGLTLAMKF